MRGKAGATTLRRITIDELAQHKAKEDAWAAFGGKVFNITPYLDFHPGGVGYLMKVAGKDGASRFRLWLRLEGGE